MKCAFSILCDHTNPMLNNAKGIFIWIQVTLNEVCLVSSIKTQSTCYLSKWGLDVAVFLEEIDSTANKCYSGRPENEQNVICWYLFLCSLAPCFHSERFSRSPYSFFMPAIYLKMLENQLWQEVDFILVQSLSCSFILEPKQEGIARPFSGRPLSMRT